jgi:hypothetical protein
MNKNEISPETTEALKKVAMTLITEGADSAIAILEARTSSEKHLYSINIKVTRLK